jgi:threonine dehydratase
MRVLFEALKLAVEPVCAAATAGLPGPLRDVPRGKRVGLLLCWTNTDPARFSDHRVHAS